MVNYHVTSEIVPLMIILEHEIRRDGKVEKTEERAREIAVKLCQEKNWIDNKTPLKEIIKDLIAGYETTRQLADNYQPKESYQEARKNNPFVLAPDYRRFIEAILLAKERAIDADHAAAIKRGEGEYFMPSQAKTGFTNKLVYFSKGDLLSSFGIVFKSQLEELVKTNDPEKNGTYFRKNHEITQRLGRHVTIRALINDRKIDSYESEIMDSLFQVLTSDPNLKTLMYRPEALCQIQKLEDFLKLHEFLENINKYGTGLFGTRAESAAGVIRSIAELSSEPDKKRSPALKENLELIQRLKKELVTIEPSGVALMALTLKYFASRPIYAPRVLKELIVSQVNLPRKVIEQELRRVEDPLSDQLTIESNQGIHTVRALPVVYNLILEKAEKERIERSKQKTMIQSTSPRVITLTDKIN